MRRLLLPFLLVLVGVPIAVAGAQNPAPALTLGIEPEPVKAGGIATATGHLTGASAGVPVAIEAYLRRRWVQIATISTNDTGDYYADLGPITFPFRLRAITRTAQPVSSPLRDLRVSLLVGFTVRRDGAGRRMYRGTVRPKVAGTRVSLQRRAAGGRWVLVRREATTGGVRARRFATSLPARPGTYRVVARTSQNGWARGLSRERRVRNSR